MPLRLAEVFGLSQARDWICYVDRFVTEGGDANARDEETGSPLLHAAFANESLECIQYLLDAGADVNAQDASGSTVLHHAVDTDIDAALQNGWPSTMAWTRLLLRLGARDDIADAKGRLPREIAKGYGAGAEREYDDAVRSSRR